MLKRLFFIAFVLITNLIDAQHKEGEILQAQLLETKTYYEVIFKNTSGKYSSFYINKSSIQDNEGLTVLKKHIFLLFKEPEKKDFLLQFVEDSVFLVYKDKKVKIEVWKGHDSEHRETSAWLCYTDYLHLFGVTPKKGNL